LSLLADPSASIRRLVAGIASYLATLSGPGLDEVRAGLAERMDGAITPASFPAHPLVARWLPPALERLAPTHRTLAQAIGRASPDLPWRTFDGYAAEEIGADFLAGNAYASILGEDAVIAARDWELGLFLMEPHLLYRDHRHPATELYAPLTGPHGWRFGARGPLALLEAHRPVWNARDVVHLIKVGPAPFLALYAWPSDVNAGVEVVHAGDWPGLERLRLG
jgi:Dimethlysulfonioproprionate lyase